MSTAAGSSSSAGQRRYLPRILCPQCKIQVIRLTSKKDKVFYKCPNNFQNDKDGCQQYWFEDAYVKYLRDNHPELLEGIEADVVAAACPSNLEASKPNEPNISDLKNVPDINLVALELKMQMFGMNMEIERLKTDIKELKEGCVKGKVPDWGWGLGSAVALVMYVILLVAVVWKK